MTIFKHNLAIPPSGLLVLPTITVPAEFTELNLTVPPSSPPGTAPTVPPFFAEFIQDAFNNRNRNSSSADELALGPKTYHAPTYRICENVLRNLITTPPTIIPHTPAGIAYMRTISLSGSIPTVPTLLLGANLKTAVESIGVGELSEACVLYTLWYLNKKFKVYNAGLPGGVPSAFQDIYNYVTSIEMENYSHIRFVSSEVPVNEFKLMLKPNNPKLMPDQTLSGPSKFNKIHEKIDDELGNSPLGAIHNAPTTFPSGMTADLNLMENKVHFANGLMQYIGKIVLEYSKAIYGVLTHNTNLEPPSRLSIVAAGDGGPTEGLFGGLNNEAVLFFNYDAIFDGTDPSKFMKANSTKSVDNISLINKNRTIHMAIFGLDEDSVDTKVFIEFIAGSTTYEIEFSANKASPILIPQSTSSISVTSSLSPSGTTVYTCTAGSLTLGFYDLDMQNFTFPDSVATNTCNVRMESANFGPGNFEESCLILNVFEDTPIIPPVFNITLQNNFRPDEFELSLNQKANNFPALASEQLQLQNFLDNLINDILTKPSYTVTSNLTAGFIARYSVDGDPTSGIISDNRYLTLNPVTGRTNEFAGVIAPTVDANGYNRSTDYPNLRFSSCDFNTTATSLVLNISSFVDPQRSRFLDKIITQDYRNNLIPPGVPLLTPTVPLNGANVTPFAALTVFAGMPDPGDSMLSYNWLLSGLRCFGILEAVIFKVNTRVSQLNALGLLSSGDVTTINGIFNGLLPAAAVNITLLSAGNPVVSLNNAAYQSLKWYRAVTDVNPDNSAYWNYN